MADTTERDLKNAARRQEKVDRHAKRRKEREKVRAERYAKKLRDRDMKRQMAKERADKRAEKSYQFDVEVMQELHTNDITDYDSLLKVYMDIRRVHEDLESRYNDMCIIACSCAKDDWLCNVCNLR